MLLCYELVCSRVLLDEQMLTVLCTGRLDVLWDCCRCFGHAPFVAHVYDRMVHYFQKGDHQVGVLKGAAILCSVI